MTITLRHALFLPEPNSWSYNFVEVSGHKLKTNHDTPVLQLPSANMRKYDNYPSPCSIPPEAEFIYVYNFVEVFGHNLESFQAWGGYLYHQSVSLSLKITPWYVLRGQCCPSCRVWQPFSDSNASLAPFLFWIQTFWVGCDSPLLTIMMCQTDITTSAEGCHTRPDHSAE